MWVSGGVVKGKECGRGEGLGWRVGLDVMVGDLVWWCGGKVVVVFGIGV